MGKKELQQERWNVYMRKRWWIEKYTRIIGEPFPEICPLAVKDTRHPPEYNTVEDVVNKVNTAKKCKLYNPELNCVCWFGSNPGRCDCWKVFWGCSMFRVWLNLKEVAQ